MLHHYVIIALVTYSLNCGFRLTELVAQGSIPWMCANLIAFFLIVLVRLVGLKSSALPDSEKEGKHMGKKTRLFRLLNSVLLESTWAMGLNYVAGALPA